MAISALGHFPCVPEAPGSVVQVGGWYLTSRGVGQGGGVRAIETLRVGDKQGARGSVGLTHPGEA